MLSEELQEIVPAPKQDQDDDGDRVAGTGNRWGRIVDPKDADLHKIADIAKGLAEGGPKVDLNVNNHYKGCSPATIARLEANLGG